jgi:ATP-binding cassette subfamily B protein
LVVLTTRGWLLVCLLSLVPALLAHDTTHASLAIAIGANLQAYAGLSTLTSRLLTGANAVVAWRKLAGLYASAAGPRRAGDPALALHAATNTAENLLPDAAVLGAYAVSFRHHADAEPVLEDCTLVLRRGDRVLLEGPSGGGKSTLAALLVGLREPDCGHILLHGLDRTSLGDALWHRRVASAPQFHENHVFGSTLAFNLLMGRSWPPTQEDRYAAETVCRELGLGPLLERMPCGLDQIVGAHGWQLSHGERSRIFLARALLQQPDVLVLDESFGALDPVSLRTCLAAVRRREHALLVIAHP